MACYDTSPYTCTYDSGGNGSLPGGGNPDYTSLATWESASDNDLAGYSGPVIIDCYDSQDHNVGSGGVTLAGATNTSATVYREIRSSSSCATPWAGKEDTGANFYASATVVFTLNEDYVRLRDIYIINTVNSSGTATTIKGSGKAGIKIINCVASCSNSHASGNGIAFQVGAIASTQSTLAYNCIALNSKTKGFGMGSWNAGDVAAIINCTAINCGTGFEGTSYGTKIFWNCYGCDNATADFGAEAITTASSGWCASSDETSDNCNATNYKNSLDLVASGDIDGDGLATADDLYAAGGAGDNYGRNPYDDLTASYDFNDFLKNDQDGEAISRLDIRGTARPNGTTADSTWNVGASQALAFVPPEISTAAATDVGENTATLNGELDILGTEEAVDVYFEWREVGAAEWETTAPQELTEAGAFDEGLTELDKNTEYEFRAVVNYDTTEYAYGSTLTFVTLGAEATGGLFFCHG